MLDAGPPVAAAPTQSLAGVESQQLAQPALPRIPARYSAAGDGAELPGWNICSVRFTSCCCTATVSKAGAAAIFTAFVMSLEKSKKNGGCFAWYQYGTIV